jgi:hypothetical protein
MRSWLATTIFAWTHGPYSALKRGPAWDLTPLQLLAMPPGTLGHALGFYLCDNGFELMPRLESHDVCHLLTGVGTDVRSEVELQMLLLGNGKRSAYLLGAVVLGLVLFPEAIDRWIAAARRGAAAAPFWNLDFRARLHRPYDEVALRSRAVAA